MNAYADTRTESGAASTPRLGATGGMSVNQAATARRINLRTIATSSLPWLIIGGLLWAGLFIKPEPVGKTVTPPVIERRDYYYGMVVPTPGQRWLAGSSGKLIAVDAQDRATRMPSPDGHTLQDIAAWDGRRAVAVGNGATILRTEDGGQSWQPADEVPRSEVANKLSRVRAAADGLAVAVGEMGALLVTHDFGRRWERLRPEEDVAWNDAALLSGGRIRVVGEFGRMLASDDAGATWREIASPVKSSLMAVAFRDTRQGVAVGLDGVVLITGDGGEHWQPATLGIHDHLFDIAWDAARAHWVGAGSLGRWITGKGDGPAWQSGRLDERDLSWHTRVIPDHDRTWFVGANVGHWDGRRWTAASF